ncbi:MAG: nicotinate-nucleotide adenylyltransferase [Gammaproteobacteria bacterium]|jgi:nicotinate-nucleotide adenylyltransferase|nr:nicotinate-nucleotide adenylyltransferase [Gammaproteobacteria bacterium]
MIGVFGGTFDPVHHGHIEPALSIQRALHLTKLLFIPNGNPPHRSVPWLSTEQRLSLLQTALEKYPDLVIDKREVSRAGPSYMVDTLRLLKQDFQDESLCMIIGMDAFFGITQWHQWEQLFDLCHIVVMTRPGFKQESLAQQMSRENYQFLCKRMTQDVKMLASREVGKILLQSVPQLDISSTQIRAKLLAGEDVSQWVPADVYQKLRGFIDDN